MGGSGGFFGSYTKPEDLARRVRESEGKTEDQQYESQVSQIMGDLLAQFNSRDVDLTSKHLEVIKNALDKAIDGTIDLLFGGSVAKHTYVDGMSDVDSLVLLNNSELKNKSPQEVKDYFFEQLKQRFPKTEIKNGTLAVTVSFQDQEIQLLPALRAGSNLKIANSEGTGWTTITPGVFNNILTDMNKRLGCKLIPTIKLAKSIIQGLPENRQLKGYHVEALALKVFEGYSGPMTNKSMLKHFFSEASKHVMSPIAEITGQSTHVDSYLGPAGDLQRRIVADSISRLGRRMQNADGARSVDQWKDILGE